MVRKIVIPDYPSSMLKTGVKAKQISLTKVRKLHQQEMEKLDKEIPLPCERMKEFVFRH